LTLNFYEKKLISLAGFNGNNKEYDISIIW